MILFSGMLLLKTSDFRNRVFTELNTSVEVIVHENRDQKTSTSLSSRNYLKAYPGEWDKVVELQQMMATCKFTFENRSMFDINSHEWNIGPRAFLEQYGDVLIVFIKTPQ